MICDVGRRSLVAMVQAQMIRDRAFMRIAREAG